MDSSPSHWCLLWLIFIQLQPQTVHKDGGHGWPLIADPWLLTTVRILSPASSTISARIWVQMKSKSKCQTLVSQKWVVSDIQKLMFLNCRVLIVCVVIVNYALKMCWNVMIDRLNSSCNLLSWCIYPENVVEIKPADVLTFKWQTFKLNACKKVNKTPIS